jgi:hypothetical protein
MRIQLQHFIQKIAALSGLTVTKVGMLKCHHTKCGDYCGITSGRYLKIVEFTMFVEFFSFNKVGQNHKEKELVRKITVAVSIDLISAIQ